MGSGDGEDGGKEEGPWPGALARMQCSAGAEGSMGVSSLVEGEKAMPETQVWSLGVVGAG